MVRISSGIYCGRKLQVPKKGVRPTKELVRQALFSVLGESLLGKRMADLFAGSGVMGLEALSNGAAEAVWIENDSAVFSLLKQNVEVVCGKDAVRGCVKSDGLSWLGSGIGPAKFDFIFADPPYERTGDESWAELILEKLAGSDRLKPEGLFVMEQRSKYPAIDNPQWNILKETKYGDTRLVYYRRRNPS